ncbi:MAG: T9SS type A sorting domain-containing protein [Flavobacteriales bacterium]|nr:T9SS type A sorting domain-containing protein [Flavobacteriales bacterium]
MKPFNSLTGHHRFPIAAYLFGALLPLSSFGQSGSQDPAFAIGTGANNRVFAMAAQPDGKHIVVGAFTSYGGSATNRIVRIERNGSRDASFNVGTGANAQLSAVTIAPDGKVLVGGAHTTYNGTASSRLTRLNTNGSIDGSFAIGTGFGSGSVTGIAIQSDGKILVIGTFLLFNGNSHGRIVRLNADGSLDASYNIGTGANGDIYCGALDAEGRLVIGGTFSNVNGTARQGLARINPDGTVDATFDPGLGPNAAPYCITHQRDGRILIGGLFTSYNGSTPSSRIARINRDGSYDNTFAIGTGFNSWVYTIVLQGDGKLLVGGDFTSYNGTTRNRLVRLNKTGSLDNTFSTGTTCNSWVYAITWQPEGRVTVGGGFTTFNGTTRNRLVRLFTGCDDTVQLILRTDGFGAQTSWEMIGEGFTYTICSGSGFASNQEITATCCVPMGCMRLRVLDSAGDGMTTGGYVLKDQAGNRIIDNTNDGVFGAESSVSGNGTFCLPMSTDRPILSVCDKLDWVNSDFMVASPVPEVSAQWGIGDQTDDGYEFWFYDPDGTYSQRKFRNHATAGGFGSGALRACYQRVGWLPSVNPIPTGVLLNVKVRGRVNGINNEWGTACRFKLDPVAAACPLTKLIDTPGHVYYSCGTTRTRSQFVSAKGVSGANRYEFEFVNTADGYSHTIQSANYHRYLNWATPALVSGRTYQVRVRASRDNGASWCPWGEECTVTIAPSLAPTGGASALALPPVEERLTIWPNPSTGQELAFELDGVSTPLDGAGITVFDATGKQVFNQRQGIQDVQWRSTLRFPEQLPTGNYFLRIVAGDRSWNERFVVAH